MADLSKWLELIAGPLAGQAARQFGGSGGGRAPLPPGTIGPDGEILPNMLPPEMAGGLPVPPPPTPDFPNRLPPAMSLGNEEAGETRPDNEMAEGYTPQNVPLPGLGGSAIPPAMPDVPVEQTPPLVPSGAPNVPVAAPIAPAPTAIAAPLANRRRRAAGPGMGSSSMPPPSARPLSQVNVGGGPNRGPMGTPLAPELLTRMRTSAPIDPRKVMWSNRLSPGRK